MRDAVAVAFDDDGVALDDTKPVVVVIVVCIRAGGWTKIRTVSHPSKACVPSFRDCCSPLFVALSFPLVSQDD